MWFEATTGGVTGFLTDYEGALVQLSYSLPAVYKLVTGAAYIIGLAFAFKAIYSLKVYGEMRTMMASQTGLKEPLTYLVVAGILIYFPTGFALVMNTTFGYSSPLQYSQWPGGVAGSYQTSFGALLMLIQVIGVIAFVRGWMMLARGTGQGSAPGSFGKGMTHIIAGVLAMNVVGTAQVVQNTLGTSVNLGIGT